MGKFIKSHRGTYSNYAGRHVYPSQYATVRVVRSGLFVKVDGQDKKDRADVTALLVRYSDNSVQWLALDTECVRPTF